MAATRTTPTATPTRTTRSEGTLARVLAPVEADEFRAAYWEEQPLFVSRREKGRFDDLLSEADVERLVCASGIRAPAFRLVKEGRQFSLGEYTEDIPWRPRPFTGQANVERVLAEFEDGATIVLQGLHLHWLPLAVFSRELEQAIGHPVQANAYYTPRGSQGLAVHHDTHDVFVLQVAGEKRWLVYEPAFPLPLKDQRYSPALGEPGEPLHDLTLAAGDTLYLPRGWLHQALTSDTDSLHITVGVNVYTRLDALRDALAHCAEDVEFRRAVDGDGGAVADLLERLAARLRPEEVARRMRARFVQGRRPILDGQLSQLRALDDLALDTLVERRPTVIADLEVGEDGAALSFEGKKVTFPPHVRQEIGFVADAAGRFRPRDIPGELDGPGRLVLVRRLLREGFLRLSGERGFDAPSSRTGEAAAEPASSR